MTANYKNVKIPNKLSGLINHMDDVESYREELHNLGSQWDLLTILGQMSGTGTDMTGTRQGFQHLTSELLSQLGLETLKTTTQEIESKAQVAVDIVIRNLFERTADIGFLAMDDDIRKFIRTVTDLNSQMAVLRQDTDNENDIADLNETRTAQEAAIRERFKEYVAKYSVYFNIILLDPQGNVLAQLDRTNKVQHSEDPLLLEALSTNAEYVEIFRKTDLLPEDEESLVYAYRVKESNEADASALGVLCLCFRFENEMEGVFANLRSEGDRSVITLLNCTGKVIASSDTCHVPLGAKLETVAPEDRFKVVQFAGRDYLSKTCATKGYQGYFGLGWLGHVLIPIEHAFTKSRAHSIAEPVDSAILDAVMSDPRLFSESLRSIPIQADQIQHELERTVWNGNVRETDGQSKVLLWNISDAGARTKMVFEESIGNLHETVVSGILTDVQFQAALAVDIMDRNLYERANDCRWWALTSAFREILSKPSVSTLDMDTITSILESINGLYTVYSNLFVYDSEGRILAVSNPAEANIVNTVLSEDWVHKTLSLKNSQSYCVSPFAATPLYENRHTYIYGAAITALGNTEHCIGGIGIVFDSEPQFAQMLQDSLPRSEDDLDAQGTFSVFADRHGRVVSSSNNQLNAGDRLKIEKSFFSLPCGNGASSIIEFNGHYYAVGAQTSAGYREYKTEDSYENDIVGLVFVPLAEVREQPKRNLRRRQVGMGVNNARAKGEECIEVATFYIGKRWFGIRVEKVIEAVNSAGISSIPGMHTFVAGKLLYEDNLLPVLEIHSHLQLPPRDTETDSPVVIMKSEGLCIGLIVDALGEIPEVCMDRVDQKFSILDSHENFIDCIIKPNEHEENKELLIVLDPKKLAQALVGGHELNVPQPN